MRATRLFALGIAGTAIAGSGCPVIAWAQARPAATVETSARSRTGVTDRMLLDARTDSANWLMYGRDYTNQRWSPLAQVDSTNVRHLQLAWVYQTGTSRLGSLEASPVVVDGIMYVTAPYDVVVAIDTRTGQPLWRYEHKLAPLRICCGPSNRGVAVSGKTVYLLTLDARLVALDAVTGAVRFTVPVADPTAGYSETQAPIVAGDRVFVGVSGAMYGVRGFVRAYNKGTGQLLWQTFTVPDHGWTGRWSDTTADGAPLNRDIARERADSAKYDNAWQHGGGAVWMNAAVDPAAKTLYVAVGNPAPELDGAARPGDNLYTDCLLALDVMTGAVKWYYQEVPHDVWGLDAASPPVLVTLSNGHQAVAEAGKTGWVYVVDATSGALIRKSAPFARQVDLFARPTPAGTRIFPGANGGSEWSPMSVNPTLGYAYVAGINQPTTYHTRTAPADTEAVMEGEPATAGPGKRTDDGTFTAIDLNSGRIAWQRKRPQPMVGGSLATAGGLVFTGEGNGRFDAFNARSGRLLWHFTAGAGCNAPPVTYALDGTQYIAVACGGNSRFSYPLGDGVFVFALPPGGVPSGAAHAAPARKSSRTASRKKETVMK